MSIKGVHVVKKKLAGQKIRYYYYAYRGGPLFWTSDGKRIDDVGRTLPQDFVAAFTAASEEKKRLPSTDTFGHAISLYREKSAAFRRMKPKGQSARIKYLDKWKAMSLHKGKVAEHAPLAVFDSRRIIKFITSHRDDVWGHSPSAADEAVLALSAFLTWCKKDGRLDWNRAQGIEALYERPVEARIWSAEEQKLFLKTAPLHLSWAFRLALHTGLRREDLTRLKISAISREHLIIPTGKSSGRRTALIPITPPLRVLLTEIQTAREALPAPTTTILFSSHRKPWTSEGLGSSFDRYRTELGLGPDKDGPTFHDLRKTCATHMIILQHSYPELISDQFLIDLFGWTPGTLAKMKRIYVSDKAVIEAITSAI